MRAHSPSERGLLAIVAEGFLSRLSFGVLNVALPLYAHALGLSLTQIGLLISLNTIVAMAFKPLMGGLADRVGLRRSLTGAVVLRSVVTLLFAVASAPLWLFGARSIHGISIAIRDPVVGALIAEYGGKKRIAQSFGWYQTAKSVAGNAGKALAPMLLALTGDDFLVVYLAAFALSAFPVIVVVLFVRDAPPAWRVSVVDLASSERRAAKAERDSAPVPRPAMASFMGLGFLVSATASMLSGLFPIIVTEYAGLSTGALSVLYLVGAAAAFTGPAFGWLSDNVGNKLVLSIRSVANIASSALYMLAPGIAGVAVGKALDDMGKAAFKPAWGAMIAELSSRDKRRRARMFGYMTAGEDAGEIVAPIMAGAIASGWGIPVMLGARIGLAAVTEIYTVAVTHRYLEPQPQGATSTFARRVAIPARMAAGILIGFGTGWVISDVQHRESPPDAAAVEKVSRAAACSPDPVIDAIRKVTGGC